MDGATALRRDHADRIAAAYAAEPRVAAVVLGGSTARGDADRFSDLELGIFWREPPTDADRSAAVERADGDLELLYPYDPEWRAWYDAWKVGRRDGAPKTGISVESVHVTMETVEWALDAALTRHDPSDTVQLLLSALVDGVPLHGPEVLGNARAAAASFPEALARAVVERHGQIDHFWRFEMFRARDNPLLAHEAMVDIHRRVLRTLLAVNRVYFFGLKSLEAVAARLVVAPSGLVPRIRAAYDAVPPDAEELLRRLVEETYDIVERRVPGVDVTRLREIFRYRRPLWDSDA
jgi:predicted nucleotidyltransferase